MSQEEYNIICPYDNAPAVLEDSIKVYKTKSYGLFYICSNYPTCDAYVGVHKGTTKPFGRLANPELREWKMKCHALIDPLWKEKKLTREEVYELVATVMGKPKAEAHIGMFDIDDCKKLISRLKSQL